MRITSQDETVDVNYGMCAIEAIRTNEDTWNLVTVPVAGNVLLLGCFPTKAAAAQELARIYESWHRGCDNHQIRKAESYEL